MARPMRVWPAILCFCIAIVLEIVPLPATLQGLRPPFAAMVLIYWVMMWPERIGLFIAFCLGLCLDVLHGQLLGQNALALVVVAFLTMRFHLQIRIFPLWQITAAVAALLCIDALLQVLIEGVAGLPSASYLRWSRVAAGVILWPLIMGSMDWLRQRADYRNPNIN